MSKPKFTPRGWDKKKHISVSSAVPAQRVAFIAGRRIAKVVFDYGFFLAEYEKVTDEAIEKEGPDALPDYATLITALKLEIRRASEIEINALAEAHNVPLDACFNRILLSCLRSGKVCLYDIANAYYVEFFTLRERGFEMSPEFGEGREEYILPGGGIFLEGGWAA